MLAVALSTLTANPAQATGNNIYVAPTGSVGTGASCASPAFVGGSSIASAVAADARAKAIATANAAYGTHIESIGYGVLVP